jgi:hypothetical protein
MCSAFAGKRLQCLSEPKAPGAFPQDPPLNPDRMDRNNSIQNVLAVSHQLTSNDSHSQTVYSNELKLSQTGSYEEYDLLECFQFFLGTFNFKFKFQTKT